MSIEMHSFNLKVCSHWFKMVNIHLSLQVPSNLNMVVEAFGEPGWKF